MNTSPQKAGASRLVFVDFHQRADGSWCVLFEGDSDAPQPLGSAPTPRLALYAALQALETRAGGLERARAELERVEAELAHALRRCA
jgi:hypothetical protein